jgi:hypothetical protein
MAKRKADVIEVAELNPSVKAGEKPAPSSARPESRRLTAAAVAAIAGCVAVYLLRYDHVAGFMVDDAWYILLAKAIATGQGYTLINSPSPGIMPFYPPGFPFLLSLVFRVAPHFPQNLWLLKGVSILAAFGAGLVAYRYFARYRDLPQTVAAALAVAAVLNPSLVFFATSSVMSECVFTLTQLLVMVVIERCVRLRGAGAAWRWAAAGAALAAFAFLTRSLGVGLLAAVAIYLAKERLWRAAFVFGAGVTLLAGPWVIYSRLHTPDAAQRFEQAGYIVAPYSEHFWYKTAGDMKSGVVTAADLPGRVWENCVRLVGEEVGTMLATPLYRSPKYSGYELGVIKTGTGFLSIILSLVTLLGFVVKARERITLAEIALPLSLALILLWPWPPLRLVLPYLPFLLFYFVSGCQFIQQTNQRLTRRVNVGAQAQAAVIILGAVAVLYGYDHLIYIAGKFKAAPGAVPVRLPKFDENLAAMEWMKKTLPRDGSAVGATNPPLVHLYTGFKTVALEDFAQRLGSWEKLRVRYIAFLGSPFPVPPPVEDEKANWMIYPAELKGKTGTITFDPRQPPNLLPLLDGEWNIRVLDTKPRSERPWLREKAQEASHQTTR